MDKDKLEERNFDCDSANGDSFDSCASNDTTLVRVFFIERLSWDIFGLDIYKIDSLH